VHEELVAFQELNCIMRLVSRLHLSFCLVICLVGWLSFIFDISSPQQGLEP